MKFLPLASLFVCSVTLATAADPKPAAPKAPRATRAAFAKVADVAGLPRVLLIGDSISIGYTVDVQKLLAGKANVHRIPTNGGPTPHGLVNLKAWLGDEKWDVIHFNWGLHDLKFIVGEAKAKIVPVTTPAATHQVSLADYEKNLTALVTQLNATGAKLIWCNTTPVPEGSAGRNPEDVLKYNEAAGRVMKAAGVPTDDLYSYALPKLKDIQKPANVHYTDEGSKVLAEKVAEVIGAALPKK